MRNPSTKNVVYEYRFNHLSEGIRHELRNSRVSLFERSTAKFRNIKGSSAIELIKAKALVIGAIVILGVLLSVIF